MIANSQPYSQAQQQRCVGIGQQQQNQLYGQRVAAASPSDQSAHLQPQQANNMSHQTSARPHIFDLANLQQFDSAYEDATSSATAPMATQPGEQRGQQAGPQQHQHQLHNGQLAQHQKAEVSLYSPSSSTSLLYHVYDQINVPAETGAAGQQQAASNFKRSNTTTILNPANLFGLAGVQQQQQQNNFNNAGKTTTIAQQELYSSGAQFHLQAPPYSTQQPHNSNSNNNYSLDNHQLMLDTILRQQHATRNQQHAHYHSSRPLSSSGASSMSGQSMALTYARQARANAHLPPLPPPQGSKSLASVLQSSQTLNHLGLALSDHLAPSTLDGRAGKKLHQAHHHPHHQRQHQHQFPTGARKWKRAQQRVSHAVHEYNLVLKCSALLILLALCSISLIKFASIPANVQVAGQQQPSHQIASPPQPSNPGLSIMNPLLFPPAKAAVSGATLPSGEADPQTDRTGAGAANAQDVLKSKLLIGEFVISSQNYTSSPAAKSLLAENIVKLMDQVFLSTEVRRVYSRMEITNIRPFRPRGIVVDCNIILADSIAYAAQQFGIALYESLAKSNERLAGQPSFIIDKNSIRFNTVPDKDLGIVPPELIPATFARPDSVGPPPAPPSGHGTPAQDEGPEVSQHAAPEDQNAVVWSEWSQWSSCVDKNGLCDAGRLHSRLRKCVAQHTGEKVDAMQCRQRFNMQDQELELADCSAICSQGLGDPASGHIMSDAPSVILPQTAPSVMVAGAERDATPASFALPGGLGRQQQQNKAQVIDALSSLALASSGTRGDSDYPPTSTIVSQPASAPTTERGQSSSPSPVGAPDAALIGAAPQLDAGQQQLSCSNCTSDEICLLLMTQKVPFCAKVKDHTDESGCGGWCKAQSQLCQPVGQNAFKCIHDSECLPDEWRCHDSACIPLSKRCDGHSNCYDSSDERDCPNPNAPARR